MLDGDAKVALRQFLTERFTIGELERFVSEHYPSLRSAINFRQAVAHACFDLVEAMQRHGLVDDHLFAQLRNARPRLTAEIDRILRPTGAVKIAPTPAAAQPPRPASVPHANANTYTYDLFLSHASEDKPTFVEPLFRALTRRDLKVWYDKAEIEWGDDFRQRMEDGLGLSRFGIVVLSPNFLKYWPQKELSVLQMLESTHGAKRILPIVFNLTHEDVVDRFPFMAARRHLSATEGVEAIADQALRVVHGARA